MTREQKQQYWKDHIEAWQNSGLSQAEYVRRNGLPIKTFGYHKRRLQSAPKPQQTLVPVKVDNNDTYQVQTPESGISLVTPRGFTVALASDFDVACLQRLLQVIG
ncbi:IS66 family insertion sequence element accessory protein TnpA [Endozoicomonas sp. 8E]|uniref:IS66 family insertion sequence element accessory protein TnpA n=1 Tax=Endozoicomonas sp. 8E TaxID=3035692 RepID=UPI00293922C5|nr:hypothetical protein [Endozoicomonas sp. 8E]WOG26811.1 hypothetical protein P6910_20020 [Endozoicomonas sp. 8E]